MKAMESGFSFVDNIVSNDNATLVAVGVAVAVVLLTAVLLWVLFGRSSGRGRSIVLIGLSDSGKTMIWGQLVFGKEFHTYLSTQENKSQLSLGEGSKKQVELVDIPGHERLRNQSIDKHMPSARAVVFVIDSVQFGKELREVASVLYDLLAHPLVRKNRLPVLIACNKQDLTTARSSNLIKQMLEKEITQLRTTRTGALSATDGSEASHIFLGHRDKDFQFTHINPIKVEVVECSAHVGGVSGLSDRTANLDAVRDWLVQQA